MIYTVQPINEIDGKYELIEYIINSPMFDEWHWYQYLFRFYLSGREHPFAKSIVESCLICDKVIPHFSNKWLKDFTSICEIEKNQPHFDQLIQKVAELLIIKRVVTYSWPNLEKIQFEPTIGSSKKNPEINVHYDGKIIGIEVKCPSLKDHAGVRTDKPVQMPYRDNVIRKGVMKSNNEVTLPLDNRIKDYLISADEKFSEFSSHHKNYFGVLVIIWDTNVYEVLGPLINPITGLLTPNSFATDSKGKIISFENVDEIIIVPHYGNLYNAPCERPIALGFADAVDYGESNTYPFKIFIKNPRGNSLSHEVHNCFYAHDRKEMLGAEYQLLDWIYWSDASSKKST